MQKEVYFTIDSDVYEKLKMALRLSGDDENKVFEDCIKAYVAKTFGAVAKEYSSSCLTKDISDEERYYGKAIQRIPVWSLKPNQYNHKIIRAFFVAEQNHGSATIEEMERLCKDKEHSELYVPTFKNNYAQMKLDGPKSYGKVFEDDGEHVWIWKEAEEALLKYKDAFLA